MRKPNLIIATVGISLLAPIAQAENSIAWQFNQYSENDDRIDVRGGAIAIKKDFGTDYELSAGIDYDTVTGATPSWVALDGYTDQYTKGKAELATESRDGAYASLLFRDKKRNEYSITTTYSEEPDYVARSLALSTVLWSDASHNRSYNIGFSHAFNTALATEATTHSKDEDDTTNYLEVGINQVINKNMTLEVSAYVGNKEGYQSNQYLRIVRVDSSGNRSLAADSRPDERLSGGISLRAINSWSNNFSTQAWYRYYQDDWGITGHTLETRAYWDFAPQWRLNPVLRLGSQSAADFYRDYSDDVNYFSATGFGSNDARLGDYKTRTVQMNVEWLASQEWSLNLGFSRYTQDNGLSASWITGGFVFRY